VAVRNTDDKPHRIFHALLPGGFVDLAAGQETQLPVQVFHAPHVLRQHWLVRAEVAAAREAAVAAAEEPEPPPFEPPAEETVGDDGPQAEGGAEQPAEAAEQPAPRPRGRRAGAA